MLLKDLGTIKLTENKYTMFVLFEVELVPCSYTLTKFINKTEGL